MSGTSFNFILFNFLLNYRLSVLLHVKQQHFLKTKLAPLGYVLNAFIVVACNNVKYSFLFFCHIYCVQDKWTGALIICCINVFCYIIQAEMLPLESVSPVTYWFPIISAALKTSPVLGLRLPFRDVQRTLWPTWEQTQTSSWSPKTADLSWQ